MMERDFLYQRRLVSFRPFVADDGVPGLHLTFQGDETLSMRVDARLLELLCQTLARLKDNHLIKR
jgi:hypothetical protein